MFTNSEGVWVAGGLTLNGKLSDMWHYSKESNTWLEIIQYGDKPMPFYGPGYTEVEFDGITYFAIG